jgi:glucan phosphoethanolaminetransferase (alkaline phosphatase superfamily)
MNAKEHNKLVGIFLMVHGGFQAVIFGLVVLIYGGIGAAMFATAQKQEQQFAGVAMIGFMVFFAIFFSLFVIPQIIGGWKIFKEKPNARIWGIVGSIVACLNFPFGTAAGVYGMWFLFGDEGKQFYALKDLNQNMFQPPQPPPSNWA